MRLEMKSMGDYSKARSECGAECMNCKAAPAGLERKGAAML